MADGAVSGNVLEVLVADGDERAKYHVKDEERYNVREPNLGLTMMNVLKITISALCIFLCMACSDKGPSAEELLNNPQRNVVLNRDSLGAEYWLEVEKNETVQICLDRRVREWKTSLTSKIVNDSCFAFIVPPLIGVDTIRVYFSNENAPRKINLAIGMRIRF